MSTVTPSRQALRPRPTVRELPADLLTPVGAFLRLRDRGPAFLLESVERGQQVGRYSFLAAGCRALPLDAAPERDLFAPLREAVQRHADLDTAGLPPFTGGAVGYVAYDAMRRFEPTVPLPTARDGDPAAPARFLVADVVVAFDHVRRTVQVIAQPGHDRDADCGRRRPAGAAALGRRARALRWPAPGPRTSRRRPRSTRATCGEAQEHIARGRRVPDRPLAAPRAPDGGHARSPSTGRCGPSTRRPYMVFLDFGTCRWSRPPRRRTSR